MMFLRYHLSKLALKSSPEFVPKKHHDSLRIRIGEIEVDNISLWDLLN